MQIQEKKLRQTINQEIKKLAGVNETDLVASDKASWETKKSEFKNLITNLLQNIESDDYNDASGEISKTMGILKTWKSRIEKGLMDGAVSEGLFGKKKEEPFGVDQAIQSVLQSPSYGHDAYTKFVVPGSIEYHPTETGYDLYLLLSIPGQDLNIGTLVANNSVHSTDETVGKDQADEMMDDIGYTYNGENPGARYKRVSIKYLRKEKPDNYIFAVSAKQGMDI